MVGYITSVPAPLRLITKRAGSSEQQPPFNSKGPGRAPIETGKRAEKQPFRSLETAETSPPCNDSPCELPGCPAFPAPADLRSWLLALAVPPSPVHVAWRWRPASV